MKKKAQKISKKKLEKIIEKSEGDWDFLIWSLKGYWKKNATV
jgi:arsenate reductase-like glutaredoxin family protein